MQHMLLYKCWLWAFSRRRTRSAPRWWRGKLYCKNFNSRGWKLYKICRMGDRDRPHCCGKNNQRHENEGRRKNSLFCLNWSAKEQINNRSICRTLLGGNSFCMHKLRNMYLWLPDMLVFRHTGWSQQELRHTYAQLG